MPDRETNEEKARRLANEVYGGNAGIKLQKAQVHATLALADQLSQIRGVLMSINNALPNPLDIAP